jgi:hypothetical protein
LDVTSIAGLRILVIVGAGCLLFLVLAFSHPALVATFVDADKLLAADWTHHIFFAGYSWQGFQLPRTPSLFPDLLIYAPIQIVTSSWRFATFSFAAISMAALLLCSAALCASTTRLSFTKSAALCGLLILLLLAAELAYSGRGRHFMVFQPVAHGGSFIVSVVSALILERMRRDASYRWIAVLLVLSALATISDKLFVFYFTLPAAAAVVVIGARGTEAARLLAGPFVGTILGLVADRALHRQPDVAIEWSRMPEHVGLFVADLSPSLVLGSILPALVMLAVPLTSLPRMLGKMLQFDRAAFLWTLASVSIAATTALAILLLYFDIGGYRYLYALIWWPTLFTMVGCALFVQRFQMPLTPFGLASALALGGAAFVGSRVPGLLWQWQHPTVACLAELQARTGIRHGLAQYWHARPIEISSEWQFQVDQLDIEGNVMHWGNDLASYAQSQFDRRQRPAYRFIVMDDLDQAAVADRFGEPTSVLRCPTSLVWVYQHDLVPLSAQRGRRSVNAD